MDLFIIVESMTSSCGWYCIFKLFVDMQVNACILFLCKTEGKNG
tara:strand:+ start:94685 stop:94816 length:132 start_codon:yes stop_codon:yes gene_type:complete